MARFSPKCNISIYGICNINSTASVGYMDYDCIHILYYVLYVYSSLRVFLFLLFGNGNIALGFMST